MGVPKSRKARPFNSNSQSANSQVEKRASWVSVEVAAQTLGTSSEALRKKLDRNSAVAPDGVVEASIDGVRARKSGRLWRVSFSSR